MKMKKLLYRIKPPCTGCPYKLGQVHTVVNPCSGCRLNGYQTYEEFLQQLEKPKNERQ